MARHPSRKEPYCLKECTEDTHDKTFVVLDSQVYTFTCEDVCPGEQNYYSIFQTLTQKVYTEINLLREKVCVQVPARPEITSIKAIVARSRHS